MSVPSAINATILIAQSDVAKIINGPVHTQKRPPGSDRIVDAALGSPVGSPQNSSQASAASAVFPETCGMDRLTD